MAVSRSAVCVLIFLLHLNCVVCEAAPPHSNVTVNFNDPATLPCYRHYSGKVQRTVKWVRNSDTEASCNQTSCWSAPGFEISHDEYLKGNFSLNITAVDQNDTGSYVCKSDNLTLSTALLQIRVSLTTVNLHDLAALPCPVKCSGVIRWTLFSKRSDTLAECDQTSCRSVKEGYQMIHNQYLKGDFSLIITDVDFSKRGLYTCECDGKDLHDAKLIVNTVNSTVLLKPGDTLLLELELSDSVKVYFNGTELYSIGQVCPIEARSTHYRSEHVHRSVIPAVELRNISKSDSGVYIVRYTRNNEDIRVYTVTVTDDQPSPSKDHSHDVALTVFIGSLFVSVFF